jgi:hypothetical protein
VTLRSGLYSRAEVGLVLFGLFRMQGNDAVQGSFLALQSSWGQGSRVFMNA